MNKSIGERFKEYIEYHINGDADCNAVLLRKWADYNKLDLQQRFDLAYFFSITYCIPSSILMFHEKDLVLKDINKWVDNNKNVIIFQSDRKYVKLLNNFNNCIMYFKDNLKAVDEFLDGVLINNTIVIEKALKKVSKWFYFGRFASYLFLETFMALTDYRIANTTIDWKNGDTATSGIMNLYGFDKSADYFDKHNKIPSNLDNKKLDQMLYNVLEQIRKKGGSDNVTNVETSLCAYRKFYKGSRYNGFYLDRQLEEINETNKLDPRYHEINKELLEIRKETFKHEYLGELNDWNGIRKEAKKLYKEQGLMM